MSHPPRICLIGCVEGILIPQQMHVVKDGAVARDIDRQGLRAHRHLRVMRVEIVLKGQILGQENRPRQYSP